MPRKLTTEDLAGPQFQCTMHMNLGGGSYGYGYRSIKFPRIGYLDYGYRGARAKKEGCAGRRIWTLDGAPVDSKEAAMEGHAVAPTVTEREHKVLDLVPYEFTPLRELEMKISTDLGDEIRESPYAQMSSRDINSLNAKGLVELDRQRDEESKLAGGVLDHLAFTSIIRRIRDDG